MGVLNRSELVSALTRLGQLAAADGRSVDLLIVPPMNPLQQIARSAISGDALATRSLLQDWLATGPEFARIAMPVSDDPTELALSAGLVELFATRTNQPPPAWTASIGPATAPVYLLRSAIKMKRLRQMCEAESPPPLRSRLFFAPANYLDLR
jgi:hypothetical protein